VPGNDRQEIVEIVGDAAGQLPHGLHTLRLQKTRFGRLGLGYVLNGPVFLDHAPMLVEDRRSDLSHVSRFAAGRHDPILDLEARTATKLPHKLLVSLAVVRMGQAVVLVDAGGFREILFDAETVDAGVLL